jgi:hypothetical protein
MSRLAAAAASPMPVVNFFSRSVPSSSIVNGTPICTDNSSAMTLSGSVVEKMTTEL